MIISSQFPVPFLFHIFVMINVKSLKEVVTKKVTKKFDVTIDITLSECYSVNTSCNQKGYNK